MPTLDKLFEPITIRGLSIKNRLVMSPMITNLANEDGSVSPRIIQFYGTRSRGGVGLIIVATYIRWDSRGFSNGLGIYDDAMVVGLKRLTDEVHGAGARIAAQLAHFGRQTTSAIAGVVPVAPSPIACPVMKVTPHELTLEEISAIQDDFAAAAGRANRAGFDAVEIHGAHGYLVQQFLSPFTNHRIDKYGGGPRERARFAVEVVEKVRKVVGPDFPILFRISAVELVDGGLTLPETKIIVPLLVDAGVDALHVSVGTFATPGEVSMANMHLEMASLVPYAEAVKESVSVPVITVDRIHDVFLADQIIREGRADMVAMARALIADPELPSKALREEFEEILPCIACNQGCIGRLLQGGSISCLLNPVAGRETELSLEPASAPKRVLVIGGGPAGMEAARVAALRGHSVTLIEKEDRLGGEFRVAGMPHSKQAVLPAIAWFARQVIAAGVKVELGTEATLELVRSRRPDAVVLASGARPAWLPVPGLSPSNAAFARDVLLGRVEIEQEVVVVGGGGSGLEVAHHLSILGKDVTLLEMTSVLGGDLYPSRLYWLLKALERRGVIILRDTRLVAVESDCAVVEKDGVRSTLRGPSTVVLCAGYTSTGEAWDGIRDVVPEVHVAGDAVKPRSALEAIAEAAEVARAL